MADPSQLSNSAAAAALFADPQGSKMLSMFRLAKNQTVATWCSRYGCVSALTQKQEISTSKTAAGSSKTKATKTSASSTNTSAGLLIEVNKGAVGVISQLAIRSPPRSNKKFLWTAEKVHFVMLVLSTVLI